MKNASFVIAAFFIGVATTASFLPSWQTWPSECRWQPELDHIKEHLDRLSFEHEMEGVL